MGFLRAGIAFTHLRPTHPHTTAGAGLGAAPDAAAGADSGQPPCARGATDAAGASR